jgi:hypothetical protein
LGLSGKGRSSTLGRAHRKSLIKANKDFLENNQAQIVGLEQRFYDDELNYTPSTHYSVTLNFKREFVRHKRIMCSIKEFSCTDIQSKWDLAYCKTFCQHGNYSGLGELPKNCA